MIRNLIGGLWLLLLVLHPVQATLRYHCSITGLRNQTRCCCPSGEALPELGTPGSGQERPCCKWTAATEGQTISAARCCDIEYDAAKPFLVTKSETSEHQVQLLQTVAEIGPALVTNAQVDLLRINHPDSYPLTTSLPILLCSFLC